MIEERHLNELERELAEVLITERQIHARILELGAQITRDYKDRDPYLVVILNGAFMFVAVCQ